MERFVVDRVSDPLSQYVRDLVLALAGDHDPQLGLEVETLEAWRTGFEVLLDLLAPLRGELPVEEVIQLV